MERAAFTLPRLCYCSNRNPLLVLHGGPDSGHNYLELLNSRYIALDTQREHRIFLSIKRLLRLKTANFTIRDFGVLFMTRSS